jgi:RHS repeat-associated protein
MSVVSSVYAYDAAVATMTGFGACSFGAVFRDGYRFTGKERDSESGLDNFGQRGNASSLGRFMSVDPHDIVSDAGNPKKFCTDLLDPQNWNRYAYVTDNPLKFADWGLEKYLVVYVQQPVPGSSVRDRQGQSLGH